MDIERIIALVLNSRGGEDYDQYADEDIPYEKRTLELVNGKDDDED